jgi:hypothetical protein
VNRFVFFLRRRYELLSFKKQLVNAVEQKFDFDVFVRNLIFNISASEISFISPSTIAIESIEAPIIISMSDNLIVHGLD